MLSTLQHLDKFVGEVFL